MDVKQSAFCPMKTDSLKDRVHDQILEMIIKNASTEDIVMNEKRLAELLNVSKLTVREALIMLCSEGVLKSVPRYGSWFRCRRANDKRRSGCENFWKQRH